MEQNPTLDVLMTAKKLLSDPRRWIKGDLVRKKDDQEDLCYCSVGALMAASGFEVEHHQEYDYYDNDDVYNWVEFNDTAGEHEELHAKVDAARKVLDELAKERAINPAFGVTCHTVRLNDKDTTTHEDVMKLFTDAINKVLAESDGDQRANVPAA